MDYGTLGMEAWRLDVASRALGQDRAGKDLGCGTLGAQRPEQMEMGERAMALGRIANDRP